MLLKKTILISFLLVTTSILQAQKSSSDFVTTWKTDNIGYYSDDSSIYINTDPNYNYNYDVDWNNDGVFDSLNVTGNISFRYSTPGIYTIRIRGVFPSIKFGTPLNPRPSDRKKLIAIEQWGDLNYLNLNSAFHGCVNVICNAVDTPNTSSITSLSNTFNNTILFDCNISTWDISNVIYLNGTFQSSLSFDQNLGSWDVSSVINLWGAFDNCGISTSNYDSILISWAGQTLQTNVSMSALGLEYCNGKTARDSIVAQGWYIHGDSKDTTCTITNLIKLDKSPIVPFNIFPNPSKGLIFMELSESSKSENLLIYNKIGHVVKEEKVVQGKNQINLSELPSGVYLLRYKNKTKKLLINK